MSENQERDTLADRAAAWVPPWARTPEPDRIPRPSALDQDDIVEDDDDEPVAAADLRGDTDQALDAGSASLDAPATTAEPAVSGVVEPAVPDFTEPAVPDFTEPPSRDDTTADSWEPVDRADLELDPGGEPDTAAGVAEPAEAAPQRVASGVPAFPTDDESVDAGSVDLMGPVRISDEVEQGSTNTDSGAPLTDQGGLPIAPAEAEPVPAEPVASVSVQGEPVPSVSEQGEPAASEPVRSGPAEGEPVPAEPVASEPVQAEPAEAEPPAEGEPVPAEPVASEPIQGKPAEAEQVLGQPAGAGPVQAEPVASGPVQGEPEAAQPVHAEPVVGEPVHAPAAALDEPDQLALGLPATPSEQSPAAPTLSPEELRPTLEAILLVVDEPVGETLLAQVMEVPVDVVAALLAELADEYTRQGRGFELRRAAGGWRLYTRPTYAAAVERFVLDGQSVRLTQAALETLAVVAYKQPVTRSRISAIRGVNCDGVVRTLVTRGLIEESGTEPETGAFLYRTSSLFLEKLGLDSLDQLPPLAPFLPDNVNEIAADAGH